jgi:hypothetical protein
MRCRFAPTNDQRCYSYLWERAAGDEFKLLHHTPTAVAGLPVRLAFSPDGRILAAWTSRILGSPAIRLLSAATGVELQVIRGHVMPVASAAFSADGTRLISADDTDGARPGRPTVKEWDVALPAPRLPGTQTVQSPAGDRVAAFAGLRNPGQKPEGGTEVSIRDRAGKEIVVFRGHTDRVTNVTFSPDGRLVVSRVWSSEVRIWEADTGLVRWASDQMPGGQLSSAAWAQPFSATRRGRRESRKV